MRRYYGSHFNVSILFYIMPIILYNAHQLNQTLKDQLSDSYRQLSASQRQLQLIAGAHPSNEREQQLPWLPGEDPLVETSITTTESFIMRGSIS